LNFPAQSTNYYSESNNNFPFFIAQWLSKAPVEENAQQDPQLPWFFTSVTTPLVLQSTKSGKLSNTELSTLGLCADNSAVALQFWEANGSNNYYNS